MPTPRFTLAEREKVVEEAIGLIKEPANWITGQWKCDIYLVDEKGEYILDDDGKLQPARDLYNRPLAQYCIEGAVNQAVVNVLGKERAEKLGAWDEDAGVEGKGEFGTIWPTDILGIDELARQKYASICEEEEHAAMVLNDYHNGAGKNHALGHKRILGLLRETLDQIKAKRKG